MTNKRFFITYLLWIGLMQAAYSQNQACTNPVQLLSIAINNTTCGGSTGVILINLSGDYTFTWTPNISTTNAATSLGAGAYRILIQRTGQPECALDTTIVVNNSDGPSAQIVDIQASNCFSSNGKVVLAPDTLAYSWSNGEMGSTNDGLNSGCYTVTATDPNTGCFSILQVCVPNINPLQASTTVLKGAKCGRPTGQLTVDVSGGSGIYSYSFGGPQVAGLPAGAGFGLVVDNISGCLDTAFYEIPTIVPDGAVTVQTIDPNCADDVGNAVVNVSPGDNFALPYTFSIVNVQTGVEQPSAGALPAGNYLIHVVDADSCPLLPYPFSIFAPPAIAALPTATAATCTDGGQITLQISGGTGSYIVDWQDLPGFINSTNRAHLLPGKYAAVVYDSLFCRHFIENILVPKNCNRRDTLRLVVEKSKSATYCLPLPVGFDLAETTYQLLDGGISNSAFGSWSLSNNCFTYNALQILGQDIDVICLLRTIPGLSQQDTICISVSIVGKVTSNAITYFATQVNTLASACGSIPPTIEQKTVLPLNIPALNGADAFGSYSISPTTGCISFSAFNQTGYNVDSIDVAVCDFVNSRCHIIRYIPTVLPFSDCSKNIFGTDSLEVSTTNCINGANACLNIVYADILNFKIFDNNNPLTFGVSGCNQGNTRSYPISSLPSGATIAGGPYQLYEWVVGNQTFSGVFSDFNELATLMNTLDPNPGWVIENSVNIIGGTPGVSYGTLKVTDSQNIPGFSQPSQKSVALGTQMDFATGEHWLIFSKIQTGCADTLFLDVACANCAPAIHSFTPDAAGIIEWAATSCDADTVFCTNILAGDLINWDITDNSVVFDQFANCDNGKVGLLLDTGYHEIYLRNRITTCDYRVKFNFDCSGIPVDTLFVTVGVGNTKTICIDTTLLPGPIASIENICPVIIDEQNATLVLDQDNWCLALTGVARGSDLLCIQLCNTAGLCVVVNIAVQVVNNESDNLLIYNAISPNGDGKNDTWHIPDIEQYPNNKVQIFNRWGNLVYQQEGYTNAAGWTGTWQDHPLPDGTYYYVVDLGDGRKLLKGAVVLVR